MAPKKTGSNLIIFAAVAVAAVAGYFMLTSKSTTAAIGTNTGTGTGTGTGTSPTCQAQASEFPLAVGSGYSGNANSVCEQKYVANVQKALNNFLANDKATLLSVDGKFGPKTEMVLDTYFKVATVDLITYNVLLPYAV